MVPRIRAACRAGDPSKWKLKLVFPLRGRPTQLGDPDGQVRLVIAPGHAADEPRDPHDVVPLQREGMDCHHVEGPAAAGAVVRASSRQEKFGSPPRTIRARGSAPPERLARGAQQPHDPGRVRLPRPPLLEVVLVPDLPVADRPPGDPRVLGPQGAARAVAADERAQQARVGAARGRRVGGLPAHPARRPDDKGQHLQPPFRRRADDRVIVAEVGRHSVDDVDRMDEVGRRRGHIAIRLQVAPVHRGANRLDARRAHPAGLVVEANDRDQERRARRHPDETAGHGRHGRCRPGQGKRRCGSEHGNDGWSRPRHSARG